MAKNGISFVLMALMAFGNALPLWADSAKRAPEVRHADLRNGGLNSISSLLLSENVAETVPFGDCDNYYDLLEQQARAAADDAKARLRLATTQALLLLATNLNVFLTSTPEPTPEELTAYMAIYQSQYDAIRDALQPALDAIDAALVAAIAALRLARYICNLIYY